MAVEQHDVRDAFGELVAAAMEGEFGAFAFGQDALIERFAEVAAHRLRDRCGSASAPA